VLIIQNTMSRAVARSQARSETAVDFMVAFKDEPGASGQAQA